MLVPTIMADKICGLAIVNAVLAALVSRSRTGQGQRVEVPMLDVMRAFTLVEQGSEAIKAAANQTAGYRRVLSPSRGPQRTTDGWIVILPYNGRAYDLLFREGGIDDMVGDARANSPHHARHVDYLYARLREAVATRSTDHWIAFCRDNAIPFGLITDLDTIVSDLPIRSHPVAGDYREIAQPLRFFGTPTQPRGVTPMLGADTAAVLRDVGFDDAAVGSLFDAGAIAGARA